MENCVEKKYQSDETKDLFAALAKAQLEMEHANKSSDNPFFKSKFADLTAVIDASRPFLSKNGLSVNHFTDTDANGLLVLMCQLNHSSGQWMRGWYPIRPIKADPQGYGSALTYAKRYTYSAMVGVAAVGEDDDGNEASKLSGNGAAKSPPKPAAKIEKPALTPDRKDYWERAKSAFKRDGNLNTVLKSMEVSPEHQEQLIAECAS